MKPVIVCGRNAVLECLRVRRRAPLRLMLLRGGKGLESIEQAAEGVPTVQASRDALDRRSGGVVHQGVVLDAEPLPQLSESEWFDADFPPESLVLVLDGLQDPNNFGAVIRSAVACGVAAIVYPKDRAAPITTAVMKTASGAAEHATLVRATNLSRTLDGLKERGFWVGALDPEGGKAPWDCDLRGNLALVTGAEGKGIRPLVRKHCDFQITLSLPGPVPSLNASAATAMVLAEVLRQRNSGS